MTRTASGMSMLLGAASLNNKTVIKNLDDFLLKPLGEAYFQWNMQFLESKLDVTGDLEVKATGTNSLMQKEVRSQRLTTFLQTVQNPAVAPFVKINKLISELAYSLDLDPDELLNDPEEAAIIAQIIGMQNNGGQVPGEEAAAPEMDAEPEMDDMDMDAEDAEVDMGDEEAEEEEEVMEALSGVNLELNEDELVQEVAKRVAKRILKAKKAQQQLDEALGNKKRRTNRK